LSSGAGAGGVTRRSNKGVYRMYARFCFIKKRREREMSVKRRSGEMKKKENVITVGVIVMGVS
jgi:hypothetical protein